MSHLYPELVSHTTEAVKHHSLVADVYKWTRR